MPIIRPRRKYLATNSGRILVQHRLDHSNSAGLIAVLLAVSPAILPAQDPFPPVPPGGYMPDGQSQNGYNPVPGGYQPSVVPSQPLAPTRPDSLSRRPHPADNGQCRESGGRFGRRSALRADCTAAGPAVFCRQLAQRPSRRPPLRQLCGAQILARVGNDVILTSDVLIGIDDMMARAKGRFRPRSSPSSGRRSSRK